MRKKNDFENFKHVELTEKIIGLCYDVYNNLGYGFLEKVYENALAIELKQNGYRVEQQKHILVRYHGRVVGEYYADLVVDKKVILELKAATTIHEKHEAQLLNYLKATHHEVGILFNFGMKPGLKRKAFDNRYKPHLQRK